MILPGLTSVTFRDKAPKEIVYLAYQAKLKGIEWGGDIHVPIGQLEKAEKVGRLTRAAGLSVCAYGSYYTVGKSQEEGINFEDVLTTAEALQAPIIRIWAGNKSSYNATETYRRKILNETLEIADKAEKKGIKLAFEFHSNTLNDTYDSCSELIVELDHPAVKTYWQPITSVKSEINAAGIDKILPWIVGVHVFHWWPEVEVRLPLNQGAQDWKDYLFRLSKLKAPIFGNLEFVKDNSPKHFLEDARTLLNLIGNHQVLKTKQRN
ncbi:MAG: sugar phosphate isomerase/epimerase [Saprospiraceae bacterium]